MNRFSVGRILKEARKNSEIKQEVLAEEMNISTKTIQRIESGSDSVGEEILVQIAEYLNVCIAKDGFLALHENNTINLLLKTSNVEIFQKDDFNEEELEILIKLFETTEKECSSVKEKLKKELELKKIFKELDKIGIKIFGTIYEDGQIAYDWENRYYFVDLDEIILGLYIFKSNSPNIKKLRNNKTYIQIKNKNYMLLKESITAREQLEEVRDYITFDEYLELLKRLVVTRKELEEEKDFLPIDVYNEILEKIERYEFLDEEFPF